MTLCTTCRKANVSCPIYPQDTMSCVEYAATESEQWYCGYCDAVHHEGETCAAPTTPVDELTAWLMERNQRINALEAEVARLRDDARRYSWIRDECNWGSDDGKWEALGQLSDEDFDAWIDDQINKHGFWHDEKEVDGDNQTDHG